MKPDDSWIDKLRVVVLTPREFEDLPEYSCSIPTGTTTGKMWRRHNGSHDQEYKRSGGRCRWIICGYGQPTADGKNIKIHYYRPIISVPMGR